MLAARGTVQGSPAIAFCTDATVMGGAMGVDGCRHIVDAIDAALRERVPVVGIWHSGGARLAEGVDGAARRRRGVRRDGARLRAGSRRSRSCSAPAAGGAAYGPALTDLVIMGPAGRVFVTGPDVVRSVTGEDVDMETLGGPDTHGRRSGVVHVVTDSEADGAGDGPHGGRPAGRPGHASPRPTTSRTSTSARCCPSSATAPTTSSR